ncbi:MAG: 16S rRNA (guanine(527)-N(7))-methyltransferase RsmG [Thermodesulfobacteriota bacterium]|nr:MAG: 16S rRNA (guanine(527)-N(7))-methyltransferase RsmG [Thermodesulfobacteriota bacterium]
MEEKALEKMLIDGAATLGVALDGRGAEAFMAYLRELKAWNRKINLTSIDRDEDVVVRHFLDSLTVCRFLAGSERLLDIGSGAGFPGLPIKIAMPGTDVVLMDAVTKKVYFIRHMIRTLGLGATGSVEAVSARVEAAPVVEKYGSSFDCVVSRAFSELGKFVSVGTPYLKPGGRLIAMKGPAYAGELDAVTLDGLSVPEVHTVRLPATHIDTVFVVFTKQAG